MIRGEAKLLRNGSSEQTPSLSSGNRWSGSVTSAVRFGDLGTAVEVARPDWVTRASAESARVSGRGLDREKLQEKQRLETEEC